MASMTSTTQKKERSIIAELQHFKVDLPFVRLTYVTKTYDDLQSKKILYIQPIANLILTIVAIQYLHIYLYRFDEFIENMYEAFVLIEEKYSTPGVIAVSTIICYAWLTVIYLVIKKTVCSILSIANFVLSEIYTMMYTIHDEPDSSDEELSDDDNEEEGEEEESKMSTSKFLYELTEIFMKMLSPNGYGDDDCDNKVKME